MTLRRQIVSLLAFAMIAGCAPKREPLNLYHESSTSAALIAAGLEARDKGGKVYVAGNTGSMEPTIKGNDYLVAVPTRFDSLAVGMIVNYRPEWNNRQLTVHRLVATWPNGTFIAEGDGPKNRAEVRHQVDATNYVDRVISIYRFP